MAQPMDQPMDWAHDGGEPDHELLTVSLSAIDALCLHGADLTEYEQDEILEYTEIFYVGEGAQKIDAVKGAPLNGGYDDSTGRYAYRYLDHVGYRYKLMEPLGKGAFGDCLRAYDYKRGIWVALKIIKNEPRYHRQGKVEVNVLELLRQNDPDGEHSLVHMIDTCMFRGHLVITFELLGSNLYSALRAGGFAGFAPDTTRDIATDILRCLQLLRTLDVVHADLKPENILLRPTPAPVHGAPGATSVAKVIDFGSSCFRHQKIHTYIQSRYYRSPEIVLGLGYGPSCDMWSLGCILFELDQGHPLFGAKNEQDLVLMQAEVLGCPPPKVLGTARRGHEFFNAVGRPIRNTDRKGKVRLPGGRPLRSALKSTDPLFADFVAQCLAWDPRSRMTPSAAMQHPWVRGGAGALAPAGAETLGVPPAMCSPPSSLCSSGSPQELQGGGAMVKQAIAMLTQRADAFANTLSG